MKKTTIIAVGIVIWLYSCVLFYQVGRTAAAKAFHAIYTQP